MIEPVLTGLGAVVVLAGMLVLGVWLIVKDELIEPRESDWEEPTETTEEKKNRRILKEIERWRDGK